MKNRLRLLYMDFDAFIAIDWSGAAARGYKGIAVASCPQGSQEPHMEKPGGKYWTRQEIAEWLSETLGKGQRLLIGFDFGFGFPFEDCGYLGGQAPEINDIFALWDLIEARTGESDFGCQGFVDNRDFAHLFWKKGPRPETWVDRKRLTEHECGKSTGTWPNSLYKLVHSKQVGKASITGMRALRYLRRCRGEYAAIWPFETPKSSAIVEIFPTVFRKKATSSTAKLKPGADLNYALAELNSQAMPAGQTDNLSDHETDALISAAGLRYIASNSEIWKVPEPHAARIRREGWIFGI